MSKTSSIDKLSLGQLALLALYHLGGASKKVHYEEIAHKAFEMAPDKMCWSMDKFRHLPDKDKLRRELLVYREENYVIGAKNNKDLKKDGFELTEKGIVLCMNLEKYMPSNETTKKNKTSVSDDKKHDQSIQLYSKRFEKIIPETATVYDLYEIFQINSGNNSLLRDMYFKLKKRVYVEVYESLGGGVYANTSFAEATKKLPDVDIVDLMPNSDELLKKSKHLESNTGNVLRWIISFEHHADEKVKELLDLDKFKDQHKIHGRKRRVMKHE